MHHGSLGPGPHRAYATHESMAAFWKAAILKVSSTDRGLALGAHRILSCIIKADAVTDSRPSRAAFNAPFTKLLRSHRTYREYPWLAS